jgi:hypothetical protein
MPNDEASHVIQGDSECRDGHYRPKKDLRNQSEEAKLHAPALDSVEDALSRESQNPVEVSGTRIGRAYQEAAGIPAMLNTARYGLREMGPIRTARTLTDINQERDSIARVAPGRVRTRRGKSSSFVKTEQRPSRTNSRTSELDAISFGNTRFRTWRLVPTTG